jgi:hypothetical protein
VMKSMYLSICLNQLLTLTLTLSPILKLTPTLPQLTLKLTLTLGVGADGDEIDVIVNMSQPMSVTGTPQLALNFSSYLVEGGIQVRVTIRVRVIIVT